MDTVHKSYYAIIPANIRYDDELPPNAKLLYGEITALCNEKGYCWASNSYFAELYNVTNKSVSNWLSTLESKGYIEREVTRDENKTIKHRKIFLGVGKKSSIPYGKKFPYPMEKKVKENNTFNNTFNNTSNIYSSSGDERQLNDMVSHHPSPLPFPDNDFDLSEFKSLQRNSEVTKCNTEKEIEKEQEIELEIDKELSSDNRHSSKINKEQLDNDFESLWKLYPNKKGKAKAKKAYAKAIKDGVTNKEIQDGIVAYTKEIKAKNTNKEYIKHGSTWFNNRAWEDEYDTTPTQPKRYGQSNYQEPVPEFMQEKAINESDVDLELDNELAERIKTLSDKNNKNNDSP